MVDLYPQQIPFPNTSLDTYLKQAASDIIEILQNQKQNIPKLGYGNETPNAFINISKVLQGVNPPTFKKDNIPQEKNSATEPRVQVPTLARNDTLEPRVYPVDTPTYAKVKLPANTSNTPTGIFPRYKDMIAKILRNALKHNNIQSQDLYTKNTATYK